MKKAIAYMLAVISGILLSLSFPNFNIWILAYLAFVPLFFAISKSTLKDAFRISFVSGLVFFVITMYWLCNVSIPGSIILILTLSLFFGFFGIYFRSTIQYSPLTFFTLPAFWAILEYIRTHLFTGFGWALLGHSQYTNIPIIQISDITGAYGVSFLVMMVNITIFILFSRRLKKGVLPLIITTLIFLSVIGYGYYKLNREYEITGSLDIAIVQGNIPQEKKWDPIYKNQILDIYSHLTKGAAMDKPDMIIWPETALPGFMEEGALSDRITQLANEIKINLLVGAPSYGIAMYNSAYLISGTGRILKRYNKIHLVPFGEYVPFGRLLNFLRGFIDKPIGAFTKGRKYTIFEQAPGARFGVLICFEDIFPSLVRRFVRKNADFMVNITNDAWFKETSAPYQHAQSSVFRAVENRVPVIRAANTGLSCFIDRYGSITDTVNIEGKEIFVSGHKVKRVEFSNMKSLYSKLGDIFICLCIVIFIIRFLALKRSRLD